LTKPSPKRCLRANKHWDEIDACYAVATAKGGTKWGNGLKWAQLIAAVKGQPVPTA
jgi:hypothetical protein